MLIRLATVWKVAYVIREPSLFLAKELALLSNPIMLLLSVSVWEFVGKFMDVCMFDYFQNGCLSVVHKPRLELDPDSVNCHTFMRPIQLLMFCTRRHPPDLINY